MNRLQAGIVAAIALAGGLFAALTISPPGADQPTYLSQYPQVRALPDFVLHDANNQPFSNAQLVGHWSLIFVGYTYCPDVCPTTMAELNRIYPQLEALSDKTPVQVVFMSVDPKRDTPERLHEYIQFFNPDFIAISGEHKQLFPLVRAMGMMYSINEGSDDNNYLVDHSASVVLVNPQAQVVGRFKPQVAAGQVALSDSQRILADMAIITAQ